MRNSGMGQFAGLRGIGRYIALDTDGDGRISKLEAESSPLAKRFAEIDLNKDGYLVRSELQADSDRRRAEYASKASERFEEKFKQADSNGDGRLSRAEFETTVPVDHLWLLGDNRSNSQDSRAHQGAPGGGAVPLGNVVGNAFVVMWPIDHVTLLRNPGAAFADVPAAP